jgi:hypothetical protein
MLNCAVCGLELNSKSQNRRPHAFNYNSYCRDCYLIQMMCSKVSTQLTSVPIPWTARPFQVVPPVYGAPATIADPFPVNICLTDGS